MKRLSLFSSLVVVMAALIVPVTAQHNGAKTQITSGAKMTVKGMVVKHDQGNIIVRDRSGQDVTVLVGSAKIEEKKSNPFRGSKKYSAEALVRGLYVEVEGRGDASGSLAAEKIKFSN